MTDESSSIRGRDKKFLSASQRRNRFLGELAVYEIDNGVLDGLLEKDETNILKISTNKIQNTQNPDLNVRRVS
jgi:hypothetical protein